MADELPDVTVTELSGSRARAMQRLQIGLFGLAAMILLIALASIFNQRAREAEAGVVPEAASTVAAEQEPDEPSDPLADAGVVPEIPATPDAQATQTPPLDDPQADAP